MIGEACKLGDICRIELGKTPARSNKKFWDEKKSSNNIWLSIADLPLSIKPVMMDSKEYISDEGAVLCKVVPKNTLIVSFKLSLGRLAITGCDLYTNEAIAALYINENVELEQDYLYWYLTFFDWDAAAGSDIKVKGKTLNKAKLKEIIIQVPSLAEQKRIVALLDTVFTDIEQARAKAEQNLKNARELFDSYLQQVFSQKGEGWSVKKVSDIADTCLGKMLDKKKNKGNLKPYLRNINVQWFNINTSDLLDMKFEDSEYERYAVKKGDLVICEGGYPGRGAIWEFDEDIFFQKALHRIRSHDVIYNQWILYYLYISDRNGSLRKNFTGAGIQHFTGKALKQLSLPVPDKMNAEKYIHKMNTLLEQVKLLEIIYNKKLSSIDELKKSILQKAFSGELTATAT